jgi:hypothetical protein
VARKVTNLYDNRTERVNERSAGVRARPASSHELRRHRPLREGSNSGQNGATSGEKWNVPPASAEFADLARVVAAWPRLRPELKAAILAIVTPPAGSPEPLDRPVRFTAFDAEG